MKNNEINKEKKRDLAEKIAPSIFAADFSNISKEIEKIKDFGCRLIHLDIMDGNFVPNISYGPKITEDILKLSELKGDLHLMVQDPSFFVDKFLFEKIEYITFHYESLITIDKIVSLIQKIKDKGKKIGISIKPMTSVEKILPFLSLVDLVLVMTVEPGFSGQKMIEEAVIKIEQLSKIREERCYSFLIEVDGGINFANLSSVLGKGADLLVLGSAFFA